VINHFLLLRNVGQFDNVNGRSNPLHQVTLVFGENGGGKTTLSAILRSLSTGDSVPIEERRRLGATNSPHVIIDASGGTQSAIYEQGAWSRTTPDLYVFDDTFVDANVYSGLVVDPAHRQGLHELVLGRQGVQLGRDLQTLVDRVETASPGGCLQRVCYPTFFGIAEVPAPGARFVADAVPSP